MMTSFIALLRISFSLTYFHSFFVCLLPLLLLFSGIVFNFNFLPFFAILSYIKILLQLLISCQQPSYRIGFFLHSFLLSLSSFLWSTSFHTHTHNIAEKREENERKTIPMFHSHRYAEPLCVIALDFFFGGIILEASNEKKLTKFWRCAALNLIYFTHIIRNENDGWLSEWNRERQNGRMALSERDRETETKRERRGRE